MDSEAPTDAAASGSSSSGAAAAAAAAHLQRLVAACERPAPFASPRDGACLRLVPPNERLTAQALQAHLQQLLQASPHLAAPLPLLAANERASPSTSTLHGLRHVAAWARGCAYLAAGNPRQALLDARASSAHAPQQWYPALLLAGQAHAALGQWGQAVAHVAQAQALMLPQAEEAASAAAATALTHELAGMVRQLPPEQLLAWRARGLAGLTQQLQDEADMRLPEVLRSRPRWYYYNAFMTQRIHLSLLELQLAAADAQARMNDAAASGDGNAHAQLAAAPPPLALAGSTSTSTSSARGRMLLELLAAGGHEGEEVPIVAAAAAAAGFVTSSSSSGVECARLSGPHAHSSPAQRQLALPDAEGSSDQPTHGQAAGTTTTTAATTTSSSTTSSSATPAAGVLVGGLALPQPVLDKLLALDAGDLDLLVQHPLGLQGQVYELLDVLQASGPEALHALEVPRLTWEETKLLTATSSSSSSSSRSLVGLPLGYEPADAAAGAGATAAAMLLQAARADGADQQQLVPARASSSVMGWRRSGWTRRAYLEAAAAAASAGRRA